MRRLLVLLASRQGSHFLAGLAQAVAVVVLLELGPEIVEGDERRRAVDIGVGLYIKNAR